MDPITVLVTLAVAIIGGGPAWMATRKASRASRSVNTEVLDAVLRMEAKLEGLGERVATAERWAEVHEMLHELAR